MNKPILFLLLTLVWGCSGNKQQDQVDQASKLPIENPVIRGEFPDPSVIQVGDTYYACGTSNDWAPIYPIYSSADLENWEFETYVFMEAPDWTMGSFWAPELYYKDGTFYCYYTAKRKDGISCIGVASTQDISQGFEDHGVLIEWGSESIDAFVNEVEGQLYVTWKAYGLNPDKPIQILGSKLSDNGLQLEGEVFEVVTAEAETWERGGIEGQSIVQHGGDLYLLYSGAACCGGGCDYKVGVARAKQMEGPWEKYAGNPILTDFGDWKCPGHGTPVMTSNEEWYYLYHAYQKEGFPYMGRSGLLSPLSWDENTGWPYFKTLDLMEGPAKDQELSGIQDEFDQDRLEQFWRWDLASFLPATEVRDGMLYLGGKAKHQNSPIDMALSVIPKRPSYEVRTKLKSQPDVIKGILIYGTHDSSIGLGLQGGKLGVFEVRNGEWQELASVQLMSSEDIVLKAKVEEGHKVSFAYQEAEGEWLDIAIDQQGATEVVGDFLEFWQWGVKPGIFVKGEEGGTFESFELKYP
ncbi:family 43 glycosylhydrolase [Echinicola sp. CAU 1574]|uniref:Family 43 glycosylhydrolase n=1 Tax=Echinicola arenosa TaxID=2774144 RepID=A0ABR9AML2_9BACT|nr:glycoside hydrolase family 43 protein [Echinicola arenosa]MBD8490049.1 family 43 glycosylhydrolase [Echinicola arenosa]